MFGYASSIYHLGTDLSADGNDLNNDIALHAGVSTLGRWMGRNGS